MLTKKQNQKLYTDKGVALCQKVDIFKGLMWYCYDGEWMNWHTLTIDQVHQIVAKNKAKEKVAGIEEYARELIVEETVSFENVVGQDSLTRFDNQPGSSRTKRKKRRNKKKAPAGNAQNAKPAGSNKASGTNSNKPQKNKRRKPKGDNPNNQKK